MAAVMALVLRDESASFAMSCSFGKPDGVWEESNTDARGGVRVEK